jgi:hypothetical protein
VGVADKQKEASQGTTARQGGREAHNKQKNSKRAKDMPTNIASKERDSRKYGT